LYAGTPQAKASHLRQARFRKATPFRPIHRISLTSTLPPSPISPVRLARGIKAPIEARAAKNTHKADSSLVPPSSPLTWDESITPEAIRVQDFATDEEEQGSSTIIIERLLKFAGQAAPADFATFLETFRTKDIDDISSSGKREKARTVQRASLKYRKVGDASYSEVFAIGDLVLKIIPLVVEIETENRDDSEGEEEEVPFKSPPENVLKEFMITKATGDAVEGFVKLLGYLNLTRVDIFDTKHLVYKERTS